MIVMNQKRKLLRRRWFPALVLLPALALCCAGPLTAQTGAVSLDSCIAWAELHYPLAKQKDYIQILADNNTQATHHAWLPQVSADVRATYQSEVTSFSFPGFPDLVVPKDQYNIGVSVSQLLYDGGVTAELRDLTAANTAVALKKNEVDLYQVKERVVRLYGGILLVKENLLVLQSYMDDIRNRASKMKSLVQNGAMLQSNLDQLDVEVLSTEQKMTEVQASLSALYQKLSLLIDKPLDDNTQFSEMTQAAPPASDSVSRPELQWFELQKTVLDARLELSKKQVIPQVVAFANGAVGRPGYNFLNQDFRFYGIGGLTLRWNINSVYNLALEKKNLDAGKRMIDTQADLFQMNIQSALADETADIEKWRQLIETDNQIIEKRKSISKSAADQLDNGLITPFDYLSLLAAEKQAVLNKQIHTLNLDMAIWNYQITKGS